MAWVEQIGEVLVIPSDEECVVEWKMDFASLPEEDELFYTSPSFSFEGISWSLGIWTNHIPVHNSVGYIHLLLYRDSHVGPPINLELSFGLKTFDGLRDLVRHGTNYFPVYCEPFNQRLILRSELLRRHSDFLDSGFLTAIVGLKRLNQA